MSDEIETVITQVLVDPLSEILKRVGLAIVETQRELDKNSISTETELDDIGQELGYDLHATWYHLPETELELKMSLSIYTEEKKDKGQTISWGPPVLYAGPLNASYKNLFEYDVAATSTLKVKIVSIPTQVTSVREGMPVKKLIN